MRYLIGLVILLLPISLGVVGDNKIVRDAVENKIKILNDEVSDSRARRIASLIVKYSDLRGLNPFLVLGIMNVESGFNHRAISKTHDFGIMQVNRWWLPRFGTTVRELLTLEGGIESGTKILKVNYIEESGKGCWWSRYNARNFDRRREYEFRVKRVLDRVGIEIDCMGVNRVPL